jgi:hypothetical protein
MCTVHSGASSLLQKPSVTQAHKIWVTKNAVVHLEQSEKIRHQHISGRWIYMDDAWLY